MVIPVFSVIPAIRDTVAAVAVVTPIRGCSCNKCTLSSLSSSVDYHPLNVYTYMCRLVPGG